MPRALHQEQVWVEKEKPSLHAALLPAVPQAIKQQPVPQPCVVASSAYQHPPPLHAQLQKPQPQPPHQPTRKDSSTSLSTEGGSVNGGSSNVSLGSVNGGVSGASAISIVTSGTASSRQQQSAQHAPHPASSSSRKPAAPAVAVAGPGLAAPPAVALAPPALVQQVASGTMVASAAPAPVAAGVVALGTAVGPAHGLNSAEWKLMEMLCLMDQHMQQLRETQQGLVGTVELACRRALGHRFGRLMLVGSAALRVETPGSDVDVVCFTRRIGPHEPSGMPAPILREIHWALTELISQYGETGPQLHMELIDDARVPILRVMWGPAGSLCAVDVSVDQLRPVDHVRWFQRVGAAPKPQTPPPAAAPLVTLTLRCAKWWLRQRQIPRTKEGGLPTLAWLLMAVHVCSLPETHEQAIISSQRPMAALLAAMTAFFKYYAAPSGVGCTEGFDGVLSFTADGSSSEFQRRDPSAKKASGTPWAEFSILDPTRQGAERLDLAPRLMTATQLLLGFELLRACQRLQAVPRGVETTPGESRRLLDEVFGPLPEGTNELPSHIMQPGLGAILVCGEVAKGVAEVEIAIIDRVRSRPGWQAPFLHRSDERSEVVARLCDVEERSNRCFERQTGNPVTLAPCHFVCRVGLDWDSNGRHFLIDAEGLTRFTAMRQYVRDMAARQQQLQQRSLQATPKAEEPTAVTLAAAVASAAAAQASVDAAATASEQPAVVHHAAPPAAPEVKSAALDTPKKSAAEATVVPVIALLPSPSRTRLLSAAAQPALADSTAANPAGQS
eukprot:TRINITY_DN121219_c0_g1_i1.p1 TRINITY_DN121219_c0_g1~~TRINITY_DN121219_c0_g1_i1.p1  ORF type:complete len:784 (-),score=161.73 TRINITY_DN121219_c0_g1_i1:111-2462(-)